MRTEERQYREGERGGRADDRGAGYVGLGGISANRFGGVLDVHSVGGKSRELGRPLDKTKQPRKGGHCDTLYRCSFGKVYDLTVSGTRPSC